MIMQLLILMFCRFTLTEVKELVYQGFEKVTLERWQSLIRHVEETVEDHYWEADGLNEEILERFIINNSSDSESSDDDGMNDGFSDGTSTSFGFRSESLSSSSDEVEMKQFENRFYIMFYVFRNEELNSP